MKIKYLSTCIQIGDVIGFKDLEDGMICDCLSNLYMYTSENGVWMRKFKNSKEDWKVSIFHHQRTRFVKEIQTYELMVVDYT